MATNPFDRFDSPNPWDVGGSDPVVATNVASPISNDSFTGVIAGVPKPQPKTVANGYLVDPNHGTAVPIAGMPRPHVLSADEAKAANLDPSASWQVDANGDYKKIGNAPPPPFKVGDTDEINHGFDLLSQIDKAKQLAQKPLSTGTFANEVSNWPIVGGLLGQNHANLQTSLGQIGGDLRQVALNKLYNQLGQKGIGTIARSNAEQQALQSSLSAIGQTGDAKSQAQPDYDTLISGLDNARMIYLRHIARLAGLNPDDPDTLKRIDAAANDPAQRTALLQNLSGSAASATGGGNGITAPPPVILNDQGGGDAFLSTKTKTVVDPKLQQLAPNIGRMIASGVPDDRIMQVLQANGVDPGKTNIADILSYRQSADFKTWQKQNPNRPYPVGPDFYTKRVPFSGGAIDKTLEGTLGADYGRRAEAFGAGAGDAATLGAVNAIAGPQFSQNNALLAATDPGSYFAGEVAGPLVFGGAGAPNAVKGLVGQSLALGGAHGFIATNGSFGDRVLGGLEEAPVDALAALGTHGIIRSAAPIASAGYRTVLGLTGGDAAAADTATSMSRFSRKIGPQDMDQTELAYQRARALDPNAPAAVALSPKAQDYLAASAQRSPGGRAAANAAETDYNKQLPASLGRDIHNSIAATAGPDTAAFLNRPAVDVRNDVQAIAGREYARGIEPIANERISVDGDLADTLGSEPVRGAIADALGGKSTMSNETKAVLRSLPQWLKDGVDLNKVPVTVDALKTVATALDRRANGLAEGSEGRMALRDVSSQIRQKVAEQFPEYGAVNQRYAGRMGQIDAMMNTRDAFLSNDNKAMDALHNASGKLSDDAGPPEFGTDNAPPTPSTRAMAMAGAREAVERRAGSNARGAAGNTAQDMAAGVNQGQRTRSVFPNQQAAAVEASAGQKARSAATLGKIASGATWDSTAEHLGNAMQAAIDLGVGAKAAMVRNAFRGMSGLGSADAARVVDIMTRAPSGQQALEMLRAAYGVRRAQMIASRLGGYAVGNYVTTPRAPPPPQSMASPNNALSAFQLAH